MSAEAVEELYTNLSLVASPPANGIASPGAALSLAIHSVLVSRGFVAVGPGQVPKAPAHATQRLLRTVAVRPPSDWQAEGPNEWNTEYRVPGKISPFRLTISLHRNAGRVFVHASEAGNANNIQILGLQLEVYIPEGALNPQCARWQEVLQNPGQLVAHVTQHIAEPLLRNALPSTPADPTVRQLYCNGPETLQPPASTWAQWLVGSADVTGSSRSQALGAAAGLAVLVAAVGWLTLARRGPGAQRWL